MPIDNGLMDEPVNIFLVLNCLGYLNSLIELMLPKITTYYEIACLSEDMKNKCNETLAFT